MLIRSISKLYDTSSSVSGSLRLCSTGAPVGFSVLENRILGSGDPITSMAPILNQWVEEGRDVTHPVLKRLIIRLSHYHRFEHALQVTNQLTFSL